MPADLETCNSSSGFLQSGFWGSFKARFGWNARSFTVVWKTREPDEKTAAGGESRPLLVIRRRLAPLVSFAYVPWGPELPDGFPSDDKTRSAALAELAEKLRGFLPKDTAFIRFDPPWYTEGLNAPPPQLFPPFTRGAADVQAPDTVIVSLEGNRDAVYGRMKNKWRYNSRLGLKKGVIIRSLDEEGLDVFYSLLKETARRDRISIHSLSYYKTLFSHYRDYKNRTDLAEISIIPELHLYTAEYEGETLAAIIVMFRGKEAVYLYGASSNLNRNLMAPYALQARAMMDAKETGCRDYDLFGIPPKDDPRHPMAGLFRFKTGFGGRIIHRPGSWDFTYRPMIMEIFRLLESIRKDIRCLVRRGKNSDPAKDNQDAVEAPGS